MKKKYNTSTDQSSSTKTDTFGNSTFLDSDASKNDGSVSLSVLQDIWNIHGLLPPMENASK